MLLRPLLTLASPGGRRGRLSVLVLHRVLAGPDPLYPEAIDAERFTDICRWAGSMFSVLPLDEAVQRLGNGSLPARALAITFDDGYADNRHVAMPILLRLGLPATVFVTTGFLDGGCMWNDVIIESFRRSPCPAVELHELLPQVAAPFDLGTVALRRWALEEVIGLVKYFPPGHRAELVGQIAQRLQVQVPTDLMMRSADVLAWHRAGLQVGAHTVSHPILAKLPAADMRREMHDSKAFLERLLGNRVGLFAYPNGKPGIDFDANTVAVAREVGFDAAVTTEPGAAAPGTDPFQIPRFTPWDRKPWRFALRMAGNLRASGDNRVT